MIRREKRGKNLQEGIAGNPDLRVGLVVDGTDHFLQPIEAAFRHMCQVDRFSPRFVRMPLIGKRVNDWLLPKQLQRFMDKQHVVFFEWAGPLAALGSGLPGTVQRVVRVHRTELFDGINAVDWAAVDRVILVSKAMQSLFLSAFPGEADRCTVIYNGVDLERFFPRQRSFSWRIGMLGNLTPRKRVYDVICALADLPPATPWQLFVGGAPVKAYMDYWVALQKLPQRLQISDRVHFCGAIADPAEWLRSIDIFVSASYSEGHQVSLLEAMASGCYCLSHCWDGVGEILPGENIYETDSQLRTKLADYGSWTHSHQEEAQAAMRTIAADRFDQRRMLDEMTAIIEGLAAT